MNKEKIQKIKESITPIILDAGYELIDVEYLSSEDGDTLTVYIDSEKTITINDCEKVSKLIDNTVEEIDPTEDERYFLNVSSWGIDRPLPRLIDFERKSGIDVTLTYYDKDKKKEIDAKIVSVKDNLITFNKKGKMIDISYDKIISAVPIIKF